MRHLHTLCIVLALAGCAWMPFVGDDEDDSRGESAAEQPDETGSQMLGAAPASGAETGCSRKGRLWPEGSRVCEDHRVTRCFADGQWRLIGSC